MYSSTSSEFNGSDFQARHSFTACAMCSDMCIVQEAELSEDFLDRSRYNLMTPQFSKPLLCRWFV